MHQPSVSLQTATVDGNQKGQAKQAVPMHARPAGTPPAPTGRYINGAGGAVSGRRQPVLRSQLRGAVPGRSVGAAVALPAEGPVQGQGGGVKSTQFEPTSGVGGDKKPQKYGAEGTRCQMPGARCQMPKARCQVPESFWRICGHFGFQSARPLPRK